MKSLKEIEYLYNNMTTSETVRLKPHLEVIEKELLELLPEREENTKKLKAFEIIKEKIGIRNLLVIGLSQKTLTEQEFDSLMEVLL